MKLKEILPYVKHSFVIVSNKKETKNNKIFHIEQRHYFTQYKSGNIEFESIRSSDNKTLEYFEDHEVEDIYPTVSSLYSYDADAVIGIKVKGDVSNEECQK